MPKYRSKPYHNQKDKMNNRALGAGTKHTTRLEETKRKTKKVRNLTTLAAAPPTALVTAPPSRV